MDEPIVEQLWGQSFGNGTAAQAWLFMGFENADDVDGRIKEFRDDEIPLDWSGLPVDTNWQVDEKGNGVWVVKVSFAAKAGSITDPAGTGQYPQHGGDQGGDQELPANISYAIQRGTKHINQSYETLQRDSIDAANGATNYHQSIGVQNDGKVNGCDIPTGEITWSLRVKLPAAVVTGLYVRQIENLCSPEPRTNDRPFFGYQRGEVLITDAHIGEASSNGFREASFGFAVKRHQAEVVITETPSLKLVDVEGWSFVWVYYKQVDQVVGSKTRLCIVPFEAYEERIFERGDYSVLLLERYKK